jgi:hypothetical protein
MLVQIHIKQRESKPWKDQTKKMARALIEKSPDPIVKPTNKFAVPDPRGSTLNWVAGFGFIF